MDAPVSSLYGPGAIICWLLTVIAVILSWSLNSSSRRYDTITGDLITSLLLPCIANIHFIHELAHAKNSPNGKGSQTLNATYTVSMIFFPPGLFLCCLAYNSRHVKRFVSAAVVTVACFGISIGGVISSAENNVELASAWTGLPFFSDLCLTVILSIWKMLPRPGKNPIHRPRAETTTVFELTTALSMTLLLAVHLVCMCAGISMSKTRAGIQASHSVLPQTPYSISEIDQSVALTVGIVTLLLALRDIIRDFRSSVDDEFDCWKTRCVEGIELGDTEIDIAHWRKELEYLDRKARCERTRAKHHGREIKAWKELPDDMKMYLCNSALTRSIEESIAF
jgi:hypothetical protein